MPKGHSRPCSTRPLMTGQASHNPMPANHMDTPRTGQPLRPHKTMQHRGEARCHGIIVLSINCHQKCSRTHTPSLQQDRHPQPYLQEMRDKLQAIGSNSATFSQVSSQYTNGLISFSNQNAFVHRNRYCSPTHCKAGAGFLQPHMRVSCPYKRLQGTDSKVYNGTARCHVCPNQINKGSTD